MNFNQLPSQIEQKSYSNDQQNNVQYSGVSSKISDDSLIIIDQQIRQQQLRQMQQDVTYASSQSSRPRQSLFSSDNTGSDTTMLILQQITRIEQHQSSIQQTQLIFSSIVSSAFTFDTDVSKISKIQQLAKNTQQCEIQQQCKQNTINQILLQLNEKKSQKHQNQVKLTKKCNSQVEIHQNNSKQQKCSKEDSFLDVESQQANFSNQFNQRLTFSTTQTQYFQKPLENLNSKNPKGDSCKQSNLGKSLCIKRDNKSNKLPPIELKSNCNKTKKSIKENSYLNQNSRAAVRTIFINLQNVHINKFGKNYIIGNVSLPSISLKWSKQAAAINPNKCQVSNIKNRQLLY